MDIATIVGIVGGLATLVGLIVVSGASFGQYVDAPSAVLVLGGTLAATMIRFHFGALATIMPLGFTVALKMRRMTPRALIGEITRVAEVVRKSGPIALENVQVDDPFLAQGLRYIADGYDADFIRGAMERDRDIYLGNLDEAQKMYRSMGDAAPAFGMIGTVLGLVNMFGSMEDPAKLGPAMAIALLTTLYGALIANMICLPIADKVAAKLEEEEVSRTLIIDGILQIRDAKSPAVVKEMLISYLPEKARAQLAAADAA